MNLTKIRMIWAMNCCVIFLYDEARCAMIIMMTTLGVYAMYYAVYIKEELVSIPASSHFR